MATYVQWVFFPNGCSSCTPLLWKRFLSIIWIWCTYIFHLCVMLKSYQLVYLSILMCPSARKIEASIWSWIAAETMVVVRFSAIPKAHIPHLWQLQAGCGSSNANAMLNSAQTKATEWKFAVLLCHCLQVPGSVHTVVNQRMLSPLLRSEETTWTNLY